VAVPMRRLLPVAVPVLAGAAVAVAGVVTVSPAAVHRGQLLPVVALVAGGAISITRVTWNRRTVAVAGAVGAVALVVAAAFVGAGSATFRSSRLSADSADRDNEWRATASVARHHLLTGVGPSHLQVRWRDAHGDIVAADYTHNEYLQLAAEDGVVAPILVAGALVVVGIALARRRSDWLAAGALGGLAAFTVHSAFDFMWHVPVVPVVVAALCGAALSGAVPSAEGQTAEVKVTVARTVTDQ